MPVLTRVLGAVVLTSCAVPGLGAGSAAYAQARGPVCAGAAPQPASTVSDRDHDHDRGRDHDRGGDHDRGRDHNRGRDHDQDHDRDPNRGRDHDHDRSGPDSEKIAAWRAAERTCVRAFRQDRSARGRDCYKRYQSFMVARGGAKTQETNDTNWGQMTPEQKQAARQATLKRFKDFQLKCCPDAQFPGV